MLSAGFKIHAFFLRKVRQPTPGVMRDQTPGLEGNGNNSIALFSLQRSVNINDVDQLVIDELLDTQTN